MVAAPAPSKSSTDRQVTHDDAVETLAERCCAILIEEFAVSHVKLKLSKLGAVRGAKAVGVMLERSKGSE